MNDQTGSLIKETPTHHTVQLKYLGTCVSASNQEKRLTFDIPDGFLID